MTSLKHHDLGTKGKPACGARATLSGKLAEFRQRPLPDDCCPKCAKILLDSERQLTRNFNFGLGRGRK